MSIECTKEKQKKSNEEIKIENDGKMYNKISNCQNARRTIIKNIGRQH